MTRTQTKVNHVLEKNVRASETLPLIEMPDEEVSTFIGQIPVVADKFRGVAKDVFGIELDYSAASIAKLDRLIQDGWPDGPPTMLDNMVLNIGSYLGEAIRHIHGGSWRFNEQLGLHFDVSDLDIKIFPFAKVEKRFRNGDEDSLGFYYSFILSQVKEVHKPE